MDDSPSARRNESAAALPRPLTTIEDVEAALLSVWPQLVKFVHWRTGLPFEDVEDIVVEAVCILWDLMGAHPGHYRFASPNHLRRYLYKVVLSKVADHERATRDRRRVEIAFERLDRFVDPDSESTDDDQKALLLEDNLQEQRVIAQMQQHLKKRAWTVIEMHYLQGHTTRDIARALGMTQSAVLVALHRARTRLRQLHLQGALVTIEEQGGLSCAQT